MGSEHESAAGPAPSGATVSGARHWDPERDPALGLETIDADTLQRRHALLLIAGPGARDGGWAHGAAIALARALSDRGRRVVLADLDCSDPELDARLGEPNTEGMSDVLFFGASLEHVALERPARPFAIIAAGPGVTDPRTVLEHEGWARVLARLEEGNDSAGELLLAFVPSDVAGLDVLARRVGAVVALGPEPECQDIRAALPEGVQVLAAFTPVPDTLTPEIELRREILAPSPVVGGPDSATTAAPAIVEATAAAGSANRSGQTRRLARALTLVTVLLISTLIGFGHFGVRNPSGRGGEGQPPVADPTAAISGVAIGESLPYAIALEVHQDLPAAMRRVESLEREASAAGFFVAPIIVDDAVAYRVLAGPVRDSATAAQLMDWLVENGHSAGRSAWGIHARPYAFLLGEYEQREQAEQRKAEVAGRHIPSYILEMPYAGAAPSRFVLYVGAYLGAAEAEAMRERLRAEGITDTLVERRGRSPQ